MNKAVYIGSGTDIVPIILLDTIDEFIYIDSQPRSEYGIKYFETGERKRASFVSELEIILNRNNFVKITQSINYLEYKNTFGQKLKYYINTPFSKNISESIKKELVNCENLIICGFDPDKIILSYMPSLKNIFCSSHTVYKHNEFENDEDKYKSLFYELEINSCKYNYNYFLMIENKYFEYWIDTNINLGIKSIYDIKSIKKLDNYYNVLPNLLSIKL